MLKIKYEGLPLNVPNIRKNLMLNRENSIKLGSVYDLLSGLAIYNLKNPKMFMNRLKMTRILMICMGLAMSVAMMAQDRHYSQFYLANASYNPALVGDYRGDHRVTLNYRNQWASVPVPYTTFTGLYEAVVRFPFTKHHLGVGFALDYDVAGESQLSALGGSLNIAGLFQWGPHHLGISLQPSYYHRSFSLSKLRWNNQWNGDRFDPNLGSRETNLGLSNGYPDLGAGLAYRFHFKNRSYVQLGGGIFHLLQPNQSFYENDLYKEKLPYRYNGNVGIAFGLGSLVDIMINGQYQLQDEYREIVGMGLTRWYLNNTPGQELRLLLGCGLRLDDAIIPTAGIEYRNWLLSGSYDINTSFFKIATQKKGGPELALRYTFIKARNLGIYKKCPML